MTSIQVEAVQEGSHEFGLMLIFGYFHIKLTKNIPTSIILIHDVGTQNYGFFLDF